MTDEELGRLEALAVEWKAAKKVWMAEREAWKERGGSAGDEKFVKLTVEHQAIRARYFSGVSDAVPALVATVRKLRELVRAGCHGAITYGELADALGVELAGKLVPGVDYALDPPASMDAPLPPVPEFVTLTPAGPGCQCSGCRAESVGPSVIVGG